MESVALGVPALHIADIHRPILAEIQRCLVTIEDFQLSESDELLRRLDELLQKAATDRVSYPGERRSRAPSKTSSAASPTLLNNGSMETVDGAEQN